MNRAAEVPPESRCPLCGGRKEAGKATYAVDSGASVIVVRNVPAMVCRQCGEEWIGSETAGKLERLTAEAERRGEQVAVIAM